MYTFGQICIGDLFNTKAGRYVKTDVDEAICVMGSYGVGSIEVFPDNYPIVLLWSCVLKSNTEKEIEALTDDSNNV